MDQNSGSTARSRVYSVTLDALFSGTGALLPPLQNKDLYIEYIAW